MPNIFISYRRQDTSDATGRIYDRLKHHFGAASVFFDIDTILHGVDFRAYIDECMAKCDVALVVIGDDYFCQDDDGIVRLHKPDDLVRIEVEAALHRGIPVIPVLVGNAAPPAPGDLPVSLQALASRNAAELRSGAAFEGHFSRLVRSIESHERKASAPISQASAPSERVSPVGQTRSRFASAIFGGLGIVSVLFLLFSIMSMFPDMQDVLLIKIASVLYYGVAGLACIAGFLTVEKKSLNGIVQVALIAGIAVSLGMFAWALVLDGLKIAYNEIAIAWVLVACGFVALCGLMLSRR